MDPLSPISWVGLASRLYFERRYDEAIKELHLGLDLNPNHFLLHFHLGLDYAATGRFEKAIEEMQRAVDLSGRSTETLTGLGRVYASAGRKEDVLKVIDELRAGLPERYVSSYNMAKLYASCGDKKNAFKSLGEAYDVHHPDLIELRVEPAFDSLRPESRFQDLLRRVGFD